MARTAPQTAQTGDEATAEQGENAQGAAPEKTSKPAPRWVKATERGHYGQLREVGEVFENTLGLPAENTWFKAAKEPTAAED